MIGDYEAERMLDATQTVLAQAFMNPVPYDRVRIVRDSDFDLGNDYDMGTATETPDGNELLITLDNARLESFIEDNQVDYTRTREVSLYVGASMLAGRLLEKNFVTHPRKYTPELMHTFDHYQKDSSRLLFALQSMRPIDDTMGHAALQRALNMIDSADLSKGSDPTIIETLNMQRTGARIALYAAARTGVRSVINVAEASQAVFESEIEEANVRAQNIRSISAGRVAFSSALMMTYETIITRTGLGFILPMDKVHLLELKSQLVVAQENDSLALRVDEVFGFNPDQAPNDHQRAILGEHGMTAILPPSEY